MIIPVAAISIGVKGFPVEGAADGEPIVADGGTVGVTMFESVGDMEITESVAEELGKVVEVVGSETAGKEGREQRHE